MPLTLTLLTAEFPADRRGAALGIWSAIAGVGVALGPMAGGLLTAGLSWHWIFWINVPIGLAAAAAAPRVLRESRGEPEPIDLGGLTLVSVGLLLAVWATVRGNTVGWAAPATLWTYAGAVVLLGGFVAWEARSTHPMLPLRLFRSGAFSVANLCGFLFQFTMFAAFLNIVQFLADARHAGSIATGVDTLPWTIMPLLISAPSGRLGQRVGPQRPMTSGLVAAVVGLVGLALTLTPASGPLQMAPWLIILGLGIGLFIPNLAAQTMRSVAPPDIGRASASLNTARQLGAVFGVAVSVAVFELAGSTLTAAATRDGTVATLWLAAGASLLALALSVGLAVVHARRAAAATSAAPRPAGPLLAGPTKR
jgi:MFS family permease